MEKYYKTSLFTLNFIYKLDGGSIARNNCTAIIFLLRLCEAPNPNTIFLYIYTFIILPQTLNTYISSQHFVRTFYFTN